MMAGAFVRFEDLDGFQAAILRSDLVKYPNSLLSVMICGYFNGNCNNGVFHVEWRGPTLSLVSRFYETDTWDNPYISSNRMTIEGVSGNFEEICEYLGLPSDSIEYVYDSFSESEEYSYDCYEPTKLVEPDEDCESSEYDPFINC